MRLIKENSVAKIAVCAVIALSFSACSSKLNFQKAVKHAESQTDLMLTEIPKAENKEGTLVSPRTLEDGKLKLVASRDWTSGFFPGELWYLYELTQNKKWEQEARIFTANIEQEKLNGKTHDMGFKIYCSFGNGYRLTGDAKYKDVIIQSAKTLATRYSPIVSSIRSWDHNSDKWDFPVIIDNMMNLELLFEATKLTGDSTFYKMAVAHANTTMKNHFRADYSSWHVIDYNPKTGEVQKKNTHQGYSDASAWARGQAWALYGYTVCYRETKDPRYLLQAQNIEKFIFNNKTMPEDLVPYWDFDAPGIPNEPRDVSAATVIASALYELNSYAPEQGEYLRKATKIMENVAKKYSSALGTNKGFILGHSTGSKPMNSEVDVPLSYADYYYLEALVRAERLKRHLPVVH